ncbi:MAG TPA: abortive infection system antitoxin AbiGi family protein [Blastocatellia bacterium]|nr:abortive infection system antitoxin AbiGi family protein [Blastocatellia bacterium]
MQLKPDPEAFHNLEAILKSRKVSLGNHPERVRVLVGREYAEIPSACVCCLADIPVQHLGYHANRYGKFAIGFHRDAAVKQDFNPVFYSLEEGKVVQSVYRGFSKLEGFDAFVLESATPDRWSTLGELSGDIEAPRFERTSVSERASVTREALRFAYEELRQFVAFVKTFQKDEFGSIYCEREWRALEAFRFAYHDVAMIVLPHGHAEDSYFKDFVNRVVPELQLPRSIPVVPWEDLVEH